MIIVLDTNVWLSELGLNSTLGAATRFFIKQKNAKIALPEVVRLETERNLRNRLRECIYNISDNHRQLLTVFGKLKEVVLPDEQAIENRVTELFSNVGIEIIEIPFSLESANASFIKTIDKVAPSDKNQQFKDGVLWADCVEMLKQDDVYFITSDKAFYRDRDYKKGPASNLLEEIAQNTHTLKLIPSLSELLAELRTEVPLNEQGLAEAFFEKYRGGIDGILSRNGFALGNRILLDRNPYATEVPGRLYIEFTMKYVCTDTTDENRHDAFLMLRGDGNYHVESGTFQELRNFGEELSFRLHDESEKQVRNHVIFAGTGTIGHKEVTHTILFKID